MTLETTSLQILGEALARLEKSFDDLPPYEPPVELERWREVLNVFAERMKNNYPYPHPLYAGQMLKPPHPIARLAYSLALWMNPNNHVLDSGPASATMEKEAVANIAHMFGWDTHLGHITAGGTMANMEGLWIGGELRPGKKVLASEQAHYTHSRISHVLKLPFQSVPVDNTGRMDMTALEAILKEEDVALVVATMGTTAIGSVDPLVDILQLREKYGFRVHVDAAYGGYYTLAGNLAPYTRRAFDVLSDVDSLVVDPHKHGLQPYGCGCILFKDPSVGCFYQPDFTSDELHLGEVSLECSRAGASAVALWATQQLLPMEKDGAFAQGMSACRGAAVDLYARLANDPRFITPLEPELDIVIWTPKGQSASEISKLSQKFFERAAARSLHLAVSTLPTQFFANYADEIEMDQDKIACLRSCLMKPEHKNWVDTIYGLIDETCAELSLPV